MQSSEKSCNQSYISSFLDHRCFYIEHLFMAPDTSVLWQMLRSPLWEMLNEISFAALRS